MRLCGKHLSCVQHSLSQHAGLRHPARCPRCLCLQGCALQICRYLCSYWHRVIFACSHSFASEWQQLQSQQKNCWSTGFMAGVHCLDSGPHLMHCPLCSREHCGAAEHRRPSSPATLGSLYLMGERQSSSSISPSPEVRKRRIFQLAKTIWFVEWKPRRQVSRQIKFPEVISKIIC